MWIPWQAILLVLLALAFGVAVFGFLGAIFCRHLVESRRDRRSLHV